MLHSVYEILLATEMSIWAVIKFTVGSMGVKISEAVKEGSPNITQPVFHVTHVMSFGSCYGEPQPTLTFPPEK